MVQGGNCQSVMFNLVGLILEKGTQNNTHLRVVGHSNQITSLVPRPHPLY